MRSLVTVSVQISLVLTWRKNHAARPKYPLLSLPPCAATKNVCRCLGRALARALIIFRLIPALFRCGRKCKTAAAGAVAAGRRAPLSLSRYSCSRTNVVAAAPGAESETLDFNATRRSLLIRSTLQQNKALSPR